MFEIKINDIRFANRKTRDVIERLRKIQSKYVEVDTNSADDSIDSIIIRAGMCDRDIEYMRSITIKIYGVQTEYICENVAKIILAENYNKEYVKKAIIRLLQELPKETRLPRGYEDTLVLIQEELIRIISKKFPELHSVVSFSGNYDTWDKAGIIYLDLDKKTATIVNFDEKAEVKTEEQVLFKFRHEWADGSPSAWWHGNEEVAITQEVINYIAENLHELPMYVRVVIAFMYVIINLYN